MKKVAIVTPEALATRSFIWDEMFERFKVRVSESSSNTLTKEEDGLYVFGETTAVPSPNTVSRHLFSHLSVNLPHFDLILTNDLSSNGPLRLVVKKGIDELSTQAIDNNKTSDSKYYRLVAGDELLLKTRNSIRIAYLHNGKVVVMDVFMPPIPGSESSPDEGFVDVLINAKVSDFPKFPDDGTLVPN